jgi:hypothetical protein
VTTILNATIPKAALVPWAAGAAADEAVNYWDELAALPLMERHKRLKKAPDNDRDRAARRGTEVHRLAQALAQGEDVTPPEELAGHVDSYRDYLDAVGPVTVLTETTVVHRGIGYAGTFDAIQDLPELGDYEAGRWLLDLKTARSGVYGETALQNTAYAYAETFVDPDGFEQDLGDLRIDHVGALWVRADGWDLYPVETGGHVWRCWQALVWLYQNTPRNLRDWVGKAVQL